MSIAGRMAKSPHSSGVQCAICLNHGLGGENEESRRRWFIIGLNNDYANPINCRDDVSGDRYDSG